MQIKDYVKYPAISISALNSVMDPRGYRLKKDNPELFENNKEALYFGSALDILLTNPKEWDEKVLLGATDKPTGYMGVFVDKLPQDLTLDSPEELYYEAYEKSGYKINIKTVIKNFWGNHDAVSYYKFIHNKDKICITPQMLETVYKAKELILANEFAIKYFKPSSIAEEVYHQVPILFNYRGHECKALPDGVWVDHNNKIIQMYDLKTTSKNVYEFRDSYVGYGYFRQAAFFQYGLINGNSILKEYIDAGYKVEPFLFIVVESKPWSTRPAMIFEVPLEELKLGFSGIPEKNIIGIDSLIDAYEWHRKTDYWDMPYEVYKNGGKLKLIL